MKQSAAAARLIDARLAHDAATQAKKAAWEAICAAEADQLTASDWKAAAARTNLAWSDYSRADVAFDKARLAHSAAQSQYEASLYHEGHRRWY
jgi:crotonobetainyl-CoA:carnitine CoA-transferase CaiB-like acyl-CoA transferase